MITPTYLGMPPKFERFRSYSGFDQFNESLALATSPSRFPVLNAATGSGKSCTYTAAALLAQARRWLVLVGTKGLQSQLLGDGLVQRMVYSHRNYPCMAEVPFYLGQEADDPEFRCMVGRDRCPWRADIEAARSARSVVANYAFWLSIGRYSDPGLLGEFDYLILDEAHGAPDWLTRALAIELTPERMSAVLGVKGAFGMPDHVTIDAWHDWALGWLGHARRQRNRADTPAQRRRVDRLVRDLDMLVGASSEETRTARGWREPWIVIPNRRGKGHGAIFSPRWGSDFAERYLFRATKRVLLTSATVTAKHAELLGIRPADVEYREAPSPFDVRRRPIIWIPTVRVDYRMSEGARWKLEQRVNELITAAIDQRAGNGIVHTGSYERNEEIVAQSPYRPLILTHKRDSADFQRALEEFKHAGRGGRFRILASPRMQEGVDLPGDLCRWQIILKVPFPDSRDPLTRARLSDPGYRDLVVAETILQMCGRVVRSEDDWATTWILDDHWGQHVARQCPFPVWFRTAFRTHRPDSGPIHFLTSDAVHATPTMDRPNRFLQA